MDYSVCIRKGKRLDDYNNIARVKTTKTHDGFPAFKRRPQEISDKTKIKRRQTTRYTAAVGQ